MSFSISTLGVQLLTTNNLQNEQTNLAQLNSQLATGQQFDNLTGYTPADAHNILNFQNAITQRQSYIDSMKTVSSRLSVYDTTMTDMETLASQAQTLATQNQSLDPTKIAQINAQTQAYLEQVQNDLNQQVSGRYIYAGSRYTTQPVANLTSLGPSVQAPFPSTSPTLPDYDTQYAPAATPPVTTSTDAWTQDQVTVDTGFNLPYGVTSTAAGFQQVIAGLRLMNAASQTGASAATYQTDMTNASTLLSNGLTNIQALHAGVANSTNIITQETTTQNADINNLQNQLGDIQNVNITQVGTEINTLQTQLQASYSATASLIQESILKYL